MCVSARVCVVRAFVLRNGSKLILGIFFFSQKTKSYHNLDLKLDSMCDFRVTFCCFTKAKYQLGPLPDFL